MLITDLGSNARMAGSSTGSLSEIHQIESLLRQAMPHLGFRKHLNLNLDDGKALVNVFVHGIRRNCPNLTMEQGMDIVMDLASSGEDYGWPSNFQKGFFKLLKERHKPVGAAPVTVSQARSEHQCDTCGGGGIAILPAGYGPGSAACVCTKGRYYYSCWVKKSPNIVDLVDCPHVVELINEERSENSSVFKGNLRDALALFGGKKVAPSPQSDIVVRHTVHEREGVEAQKEPVSGGASPSYPVDIPF